MNLEDERAVTLALNSRIQLAPESEYFGTPVMRAAIVIGSGEYIIDGSRPRLPLTIDIHDKTCAFMGASNGKWKADKIFDRGELNVIKNFVNIEPSVIPEDIKEMLWNVNAVYPQPYDIESYNFPALQTVYPDDTSVLNSMFTAIAITYIYTVAYEAQRRYSGNTKMSDQELLSKVDAFMMSKLSDAFADMFNVTVKSELTDFDVQAGYSWTTKVTIKANVAKTVMTLEVDALRA
jgi:hypothetical protein